jgi:hypothetical protein
MQNWNRICNGCGDGARGARGRRPCATRTARRNSPDLPLRKNSQSALCGFLRWRSSMTDEQWIQWWSVESEEEWVRNVKRVLSVTYRGYESTDRRPGVASDARDCGRQSASSQQRWRAIENPAVVEAVKATRASAWTHLAGGRAPFSQAPVGLKPPSRSTRPADAASRAWSQLAMLPPCCASLVSRSDGDP